MSKLTSIMVRFVILAASMMLLVSCAVTTKTSEGTSETFQNTSDASTKFTSSTSPSGDSASNEHKIRAFASANLDQIREDMARGNGEHLAAFAHLLGIAEVHQADFFSFTKERYSVLFSTEPTTSKDLLARLEPELESHPTWMQ